VVTAIDSASTATTGAVRRQPSAGRECGTCALCCKVVAVDALGKGPGVWCKHAVPRHGCGIYATRPEECRTFNCTWLLDERLGDHWKPERSKFVLITARDGNGIEVRCDTGFPTAWRREPFYSQIVSWSRDAEQSEGIVVVYIGASATLITPDREFPLGELGAKDRIAREMEGGRVVRAYVVKGVEAEAVR
jgi:hypothetical protein